MRYITPTQACDDAFVLVRDPSLLADVADVSGLADDREVIVPLAAFSSERAALLARFARLGVWLGPEDDPRALAGLLEDVALVAIDFPAFTDGRGYSHARVLRQELGYSGPLRAIGDVLHDQLFIMRRCGFDQFALRADKSVDEAIATGFSTFSTAYQPAVDDLEPTIFRRP